MEFCRYLLEQISDEINKVIYQNNPADQSFTNMIENNFGSIYIRDINKKRYTIKNQINMDNIIKKMENEFVTINISDSNFTDLKTLIFCIKLS